MDPRFKADGSEFDNNTELFPEMAKYKAVDPVGCDTVRGLLLPMTGPKTDRYKVLEGFSEPAQAYGKLWIYYQ